MKYALVRVFPRPSTTYGILCSALLSVVACWVLSGVTWADDNKDDKKNKDGPHDDHEGNGGAPFGLYNPTTGEIRLYDFKEDADNDQFGQVYQNWVGANGGILFGDFNADGKRDFLAINQFKHEGRLYTGIGIYLRVCGTPAYKLSYSQSLNAGTTVRIGDFDGDGADDLLFYHYFDWASKAYTHFEVHTLHPKETAEVRLDARLAYSGNFTGYYSAEVGDFDGDDCADLLAQHSFTWQGVRYEAVELFVLTPGKDGTVAKLLHSASHPANSKVVIGDFDADGKSDYAVWQQFTYKGLPYTGVQVRSSNKAFAETSSTATHANSVLRSGQLHSGKIHDLVMNHTFKHDKLEYEAAETWRFDGKSGHIRPVAGMSHLGFIRPGTAGSGADDKEGVLIAYNPNGGQAGVFELNGKYRSVWKSTLPGAYKLVAGPGDPQP